MNSLEVMKLDKSKMNFIVEKLYDSNKDIKVAIHKNNSIYSIDKNKNVLKIVSDMNKMSVGSEEIMDALNTKQISSVFDNKYKLVIPNKLSNTITCVAENCLVTKKIENQILSTVNNIATKFELNDKTDEFVSLALDQSSKINATSYKIFEDSIKSIGENIINILQVIVNPNLKDNNSTVSQEINKPLANDLTIAVKGTVEDVNLKKVSSILTGNSKLLLKIGDMLFSIRDVGIIYTSDGENWTNVEGEIGSKSIKTTFKLSNYLIALCTDNSFYYSLNGVNWTRITDPNNYLSPSVTIDDLYILSNPDCVCIKVGTNYYDFTTEHLGITVSTGIGGKQIYKTSNNTLFFHDERFYIGIWFEAEQNYYPPSGGYTFDPGSMIIIRP